MLPASACLCLQRGRRARFTSASQRPACSSAGPGAKCLRLLRQTERTGHISPLLYPSCMKANGKDKLGKRVLEIHAALCQMPSARYFPLLSGPVHLMFSSPLNHSVLAQCFLTTVSSLLSHTGRGRGEPRRKRRRKGGRWEEKGARGEAGPTVPAEWFQASAGMASPARLRRVNTSDTVRLLWVLLQASAGASPEVPLLRVPCSERYEPGCSKSEQSVDDLWVWRLGDSACLPTRPGKSSEEFTSRLLFQALRTVTCLASEAPASEGALWLFHLIVSAVGAWLLLSTGSDGLIIMLLRETTVSGLFFGDPSPVLSASLNCKVMSCL